VQPTDLGLVGFRFSEERSEDREEDERGTEQGSQALLGSEDLHDEGKASPARDHHQRRRRDCAGRRHGSQAVLVPMRHRADRTLGLESVSRP
jgi:hypothetical protein